MKARHLVAGISILVLGFFCAAANTDGFTNWNKYGWLGKPPAQAGTDLNNSGVADEQGNELESGKVYEMPKAMVYSLLSAESETAGKGITIRATVQPALAADKRVDYAMEFENANSTWARGKEVTDYLKLTQAADGSSQAQVVCSKAFGEPIIITAASRANPEITATCKVDYAQHVESVALYIGDVLLNPNGDTNVTVNIGSATAGRGGKIRLVKKVSETYTLADSITENVVFSNDITRENGGIAWSSSYGGKYGAGEGRTYSALYDPLSEEMYFDLRLFSDYGFRDYDARRQGTNYQEESEYWAEQTTEWIKNLYETETKGAIIWQVSVNVTGTYGTHYIESDIVWAGISGYDSVTGIELDKDHVILPNG